MKNLRISVFFVVGAAMLVGLASTPSIAGESDDDREMTVTEFHEWTYFTELGWVAVQHNDFVNAAKRFKTAIGFARIGARKDPRLLARSYSDMAYALHRQGRNAEAEPMARWALEVREKGLRVSSEMMAQNSYTLAMIEIELAKFAEAESHLHRAVAGYEKAYGKASGKLAPFLNDLAYFYMTQRKYAKAEPIYARCLATPEKELPAGDPSRVVSLFGMGNVYFLEGQNEKAEPYYKQALERLEVRDTNPTLHAELLDNYSSLLRQSGRPAEADSFRDRAAALRSTPTPKPKPVSARPSRTPGS
jgi:tetratricopeptide (TPR) repeat protein